MSSHEQTEAPPDSFDEVEAGKRSLSQVRDAAPDAELWWFDGNHEARYARCVGANLPHARRLLDLPTLLDLKGYGASYVPYPEKRYMGEVAYKHSCGEAIHYLHNALIAEDSCVVLGHTHRPKTEHKITGSGRFIWGMGLGCGQAVKQIAGASRPSTPNGPDWMKGKPAPWVHATGLVSELPDGRTWPSLAICRDGAIVYGDRVYDGRSA